MMELMKSVIGMGLPVLGNALGGPLGGVVASMIAKAIGAPSAATPDILDKLNTMEESEAVQKLKSAEAEHVATIQAQAQVAGIVSHEVGETQRAECSPRFRRRNSGGGGDSFSTCRQAGGRSWRIRPSSNSLP
jgi:hypothetical protein